MESQRMKKGSFTSWLLMLSVFALREYKTEGLSTNRVQKYTHMEKQPGELQNLEDYHRHEVQFIAVGKTSLLDYKILHVIDGVNVCIYDKKNKQLRVKEAWISLALGEEFIKEKKKVIWESEVYFHLALKFLLQNDTSSHKNHTIQILAVCELDGDIEVTSQVRIAIDGEVFFQVDDQADQWDFLKPLAKQFKSLLKSHFWTDLRKQTMKQYCVNMMRKILQYSPVKKNVPPQVTVSHHDDPDGNITLSCLATGFYPCSIQLHWEKNEQLGVWGQERSSGTLPNADDTFYLQVTLEVPPSDTVTGYTCVVQHSALEMPVTYPVPTKPLPSEYPWPVALGILVAFIIVLSCAGIFTVWKKKTGQRTHEQATMDGIQLSTQTH